MKITNEQRQILRKLANEHLSAHPGWRDLGTDHPTYKLMTNRVDKVREVLDLIGIAKVMDATKKWQYEVLLRFFGTTGT